MRIAVAIAAVMNGTTLICFSMEAKHKKEWQVFKEQVKNKLNKEQFELVCSLHAHYFNHTFYRPCTCTPRTIKQWIDQLNKLYEEDNNNKQI